MVDLVEQYYKEQEWNCSFCEELRKKSTLLIEISYYKNDPSILTIFPEH